MFIEAQPSEAAKKPLFEIKIKSREVKYEARIELRDGSSFVCEYTVLSMRIEGEDKKRLTELAIVTDKGRVDLYELTGLPREFPVFIVEDSRRNLVRSEGVSEAIHIGAPVSLPEIATALHEIGHYSQYEDDEFAREFINNRDDFILKTASINIEKKYWIAFVGRWNVIQEILKRLPLKKFVPDFIKNFQSFSVGVVKLI